ncbi:formate dehydrogenase subunit gamma [Defluviimonas sp. 20V17]|uniref:Formate dehydrogenase gamma subunit n=1 Tax=Allgaiera indica TaxID=765699 RepID=A0AAN4ZXV8_9RHOB|nr:formate dehydrogenase subunit gamma [Allgaiera indica]KDB05266.1 formate dehydrogenase subunit gamma [Defluviimonas sp. 20V17]GHD99028.1 formate dehydrogenase subunit gamma [Allgaiera indica]SDW01654.1 formate dehydrogenase gamma subunit [Allgaiera indica]
MAQPSPDIASRVEEIIADHAALEGPLLPILHAVQAAFGHIPRDALPVIADKLNLSRAEVHGVMSFYHDFREDQAGRHVLKLCRAEACQAMGADRVAAHARGKLGIEWHQTTQDGAVTLEPVFCLGLCACGPAAMVDGKVVGRVDEARVDELLAEVR